MKSRNDSKLGKAVTWDEGGIGAATAPQRRYMEAATREGDSMPATMDELYETDPHAWSLTQAEALRELARTGRPAAHLDVRHLIEELDGMAAHDRRRVESLASRIMEHLLLLEHSPSRQPRRHWRVELGELRDQLETELTPTLRNGLALRLNQVFERARRRAEDKLRQFDEQAAAAALPLTRPYSTDQVLGDWYPPEPPG